MALTRLLPSFIRFFRPEIRCPLLRNCPKIGPFSLFSVVINLAVYYMFYTETGNERVKHVYEISKRNSNEGIKNYSNENIKGNYVITYI
jgi:hypothetical protein